MDFFDGCDELERDEKANQARLARIRQRTFLWQAEELAKHERILKILNRRNKVKCFDVFKYRPAFHDGDSSKIRKKSRQQSMLLCILFDLYNYLAFGYHDELRRRVVPKSKMTFLGLRSYYRKYTGIEDGPRSIRAREHRKLLMARLARAKERNGKPKME